MATDGTFTPPQQWRTISLTAKSARFVNDEAVVEVRIRPVHRRSRRKADRETPTHYVVEVHQDWFSRGAKDDRKMGARAQTWDEALALANEFMSEFLTERSATADAEVEAIHRSAEDHETADRMLNYTAIAEALADAAGYSDDLLLEVVETMTNGQQKFVGHRDGSDIEAVYGDPDCFTDDTPLRAIYGSLSIDSFGVTHLLPVSSPLTTVVHLDECTLYRFIYEDHQETDVALFRGTRVTSPAFEQAIQNVLEEKW